MDNEEIISAGKTPDEEKLVWHYTDANGLLGIVRDRRLWATRVSFLNDSSEWLYGKNLLEAYVEWKYPGKFKELFPTLTSAAEGGVVDLIRDSWYVTCASNVKDSLTMWRNYGKATTSYAVGFTKDARLDILFPDGLPSNDAGNSNVEHAWRDVTYASELPDDLKIEVDQFYDSYASGRASLPLDHISYEILSKSVSLIKHPAFEDEHEARIFFEAGRNCVSYRPSQLGVIPYCMLTGRVPRGYAVALSTTPTPQMLPIREIWISPGALSGSRDAVRSLLASSGYEIDENLPNSVTIHESTSPYR